MRVRVCPNCHRLPLRAGGCTLKCAAQTIGIAMLNLLVISVISSTVIDGLREELKEEVNDGGHEK